MMSKPTNCLGYLAGGEPLEVSRENREEGKVESRQDKEERQEKSIFDVMCIWRRLLSQVANQEGRK